MYAPVNHFINLPKDEEGSSRPLTKYRRQSVVLTLPAGMEVADIDWFAVWSQSLKTSLAQV